MDKLLAIVFMAMVVEGIIEYVKLGFQKSFCAEIIASMIIGPSIAFLFDLDIFSALGIVARFDYVGNILTGLVIARGSNYVFDLIGKFTEAKEELDTILKGDEARPDEVNEDVVNHESVEGIG
jgi:hypothetical protein